LKGLKSFLLKISSEEHGHLVLISIFDSVDDTKLVSKIVLDELFRSIDELLQNDYGRKVVSYLIAPRDTRFFYKDYNKRLEGGDASETSKKEKKIRYEELLQYSIKYLAEYLNKNLEKCLRNGPVSVLVPLIINKLENSDETFSKLANLLLTSPYAAVDKAKEGETKKEDLNEHLIENSVSHLALKHVFINDKEFEAKKLTSNTFLFELMII
jgi:pumilio family protein 6